MIYNNINNEGIETTISSGGVLLQYAIDAGYTAELFFQNTHQAEQALGISNINNLTMVDFLAYYLKA